MAEAPLTVMGPGTRWEGDLTFEGRVRVDGHFDGRMYTEDLLEVGTEGRIEGEIDVARAVVSGTVNGMLRVREHLLVESTGRIEGEIRYGKLCIESGGQVIGTIEVLGEGDTVSATPASCCETALPRLPRSAAAPADRRAIHSAAGPSTTRG